MIFSSEVTAVATTHTFYLEVAYLQKIVLCCLTFLYHDLSCELWKIYYAEFHGLGWLSKCWFTGSICRQHFFVFFPVKDTESCLHLQLRDSCAAWCIPDLGALASHGFVAHFMMSLQPSLFVKMIRGYRIQSNTSRFSWRDYSHREWVDSQPSPLARAIKISSSAENVFCFWFQTKTMRNCIIFLKRLAVGTFLLLQCSREYKCFTN